MQLYIDCWENVILKIWW